MTTNWQAKPQNSLLTHLGILKVFPSTVLKLINIYIDLRRILNLPLSSLDENDVT